MKLRVGLFAFVVCLTVALYSCRRNQPTLVDTNRPPDTELWYAPADSSDSEYLVHLYWRGLDADGTPVRYVWAILDSITPPPLGWNPSARIADFRAGRITTKTDSIFAFTAFKNQGGVGLRKNRQAFYIAAIDDNGVIDPSPAAIEFIATVAKLPEIRFATTITRVLNGNSTTTTKAFNPAQLDTVGMFRPFSISYHGLTTNGGLRAYRFFPLTAGVDMVGADVWTADLSDTVRVFTNAGRDTLPSGTFKLAAQVRDEAGAESRIDSGQFTEGVCRVVVNFEPDTRIFKILNTVYKNGQAVVDSVDFRDSQPDTLPYGSWITLFYQGWDNPYDSTLCQDVDNKCIRYQVQFTRRGEVDGGPSQGGSEVSTTIRWLPEAGEDNNPFGTTDSTSMTLGTEDYVVRVRALDEFAKADGTPFTVPITGNFSPTIDGFSISNHDGTVAGDGDTITWDWFKPANLNNPPTFLDTLDFTSIPPRVVKRFFFVIRANGHDHPREGDGAGVRGWYYEFRNTIDQSIARLNSSGAWVDATTPDVLLDTIKVTIRYPYVFEDPQPGSDAFAALPTFLNQNYNFMIRGRDFALLDEYSQFMFVNRVKLELNSYLASVLSRWTGKMEQQVYLQMKK